MTASHDRHALVSVDVALVAADLRMQLDQGNRRAVEAALVQYAPDAQAALVQQMYAASLALERVDAEQTLAWGRKRYGSLEVVERLESAVAEVGYDPAAAGSAAERLFDCVRTADAPAVAAALDATTIGAMIAARAGEASASIAHVLDPAHFGRALAADPEIWFMWEGPKNPLSNDARKRTRGINVEHLTRVLWTLLQVSDARACVFLGIPEKRTSEDARTAEPADDAPGFRGSLRDDLFAFPLAVMRQDEVKRESMRWLRPSEDFACVDLADVERTEQSPDDAHRAYVDPHPEIDIDDEDLAKLYRRVRDLDRAHYEELVRRAEAMDVVEVAESLLREAESIMGVQFVTVFTTSAGAGDDMFDDPDDVLDDDDVGDDTDADADRNDGAPPADDFDDEEEDGWESGD